MISVKRKLKSTDVLDALPDLFILRGPPAFVRSNNGSEFFTQAERDWIAAPLGRFAMQIACRAVVGAKTAFIEPSSPWENSYVQSFNAWFRDELLKREIFYSLVEAQIIIEGWRKH